jgi:hypothetical protein
MHKTSSTSVQQNLKKMKKSTGSRLFTVGGRPNMGPALHAMFLDESEKCFWYTNKGQSPEEVAKCGEQWRKKLQKSIQRFNGEVCILSGEALSESLFGEKSISALRDFLLPMFDEIRVIGYVRPPYQYKNSRYQECIKANMSKFDPGRVRLNYRARFEKWDKVFGVQNVHLVKFNPSTFSSGCAVADFCQQIGIALPQSLNIRRFNESLSQSACGILYAYRKFGPGYGVGNVARLENAYLIRALRLMGGKKFELSRSTLAPSVDSERGDIEWIESRLGVSLDEPNIDKGLEISCEADLLRVSQASCEEFVKCFEDVYSCQLEPPFVAQSDPVEPAQVAELVESCRGICRELVRQKLQLEKITKHLPEKSHYRSFGRWLVAMSQKLSKLIGRSNQSQTSHSSSLDRIPFESVAGMAKRRTKK